MRSWVFRNRQRLEALLGRPSRAAPGPPPAGTRAPTRTPRVVVLQPVRRRSDAR